MKAAFHDWPTPTAEQFVAGMNVWQDCRCAMCGVYGVTVLDHDHDTGLTRGYLCHGCNIHEGMGNPRFNSWRTGDNPATIHGWAEVYESPWLGRETIRGPRTSREDMLWALTKAEELLWGEAERPENAEEAPATQ